MVAGLVSLSAMSDIELRPATAADEPFLRRVYAATRDDVDLVQWGQGEKEQFLDMQFRAQTMDYEARFPAAELSVIVVDGQDQGRLWVDRSEDEIRLLDIALLPQARNRGTGKHLLERLIAEAKRDGLPLRHAVLKSNVAGLRFYRRLGFEVHEDTEVYAFMVWQAAG